MHNEDNSAGFTLLETTISLGIFAILLGAVLSITVENSAFLSDIDDDVTVLTEGNRSFTRLTEVLRKSGRMDDGGITYPRVTADGSELEFRILEDIDGNGYAFDAITGDLEWDARIFTIKADEEGNLDVYHGTDTVHRLGRHIFGLNLNTIEEDNTLHLKEIRINFEARKPTRGGYDAVHSVLGSIHMRN